MMGCIYRKEAPSGGRTSCQSIYSLEHNYLESWNPPLWQAELTEIGRLVVSMVLPIQSNQCLGKTTYRDGEKHRYAKYAFQAQGHTFKNYIESSILYSHITKIRHYEPITVLMMIPVTVIVPDEV